MKQCNKCGCICDDTQNFCNQCGNNLNAAPQQPTPQYPIQPQYVPAPQPPKKKKKWWIIIVVILVICVLGSLASMGNNDANESTSDNTSTSDSAKDTTENSKYITLEEYNKIESGMTYDEVKEIIGSDGELLSTSSMNDYTISIYVWYGEGMIGANANVTFTNGKVTGKAQAGLK